MNIVFLDGYTTNPGDLSWEPFRQFGNFTVYDRTAPADVIERAKDAEILILNKPELTAHHLDQLPKLKFICVASAGYDTIDVEAARARNITQPDMVMQQWLRWPWHIYLMLLTR